MSSTQYGSMMQDYVQVAVFVVLPVIGLALISLVGRGRRWAVVSGMVLLLVHAIGDSVWNGWLVDVVLGDPGGGLLPPDSGITTVVGVVLGYLPMLALLAGILLLIIAATRRGAAGRATTASPGPPPRHPPHQPPPSPGESHGREQGHGPHPPTSS